MHVSSPTNSITLRVGCLHKRNEILLGHILKSSFSKKLLVRAIFAAKLLREFLPGLQLLTYFSPLPSSAKPMPLHFETPGF